MKPVLTKKQINLFRKWLKTKWYLLVEANQFLKIIFVQAIIFLKCYWFCVSKSSVSPSVAMATFTALLLLFFSRWTRCKYLAKPSFNRFCLISKNALSKIVLDDNPPSFAASLRIFLLTSLDKFISNLARRSINDSIILLPASSRTCPVSFLKDSTASRNK